MTSTHLAWVRHDEKARFRVEPGLVVSAVDNRANCSARMPSSSRWPAGPWPGRERAWTSSLQCRLPPVAACSESPVRGELARVVAEPVLDERANDRRGA